MGLCHEFGSQIRTGCNHPMRAGASACSCAECGVVCRGLFDGCPDVWARGPRPVSISATRASAANGAPAAVATTPPTRPQAAAKAEPTAPAGDGGSAGGIAEGLRSAAGGIAEGLRSDAGAIAYLEAPPVAIGPGIVGRAGAENLSGPTGRRAGDDRLGGGRRTTPRHDRSGQSGQSGQSGKAKAMADGESEADAGRDTSGDPRREVFRWFEEAFEGVRGELQALIGSMTHQQAMLAELLDSRQAELRLALVAESLPDLVADAVRAAMDEHTSALAESYDQSHDRFRDDVEQIRADTAATVEALNESFQRLSSAIAVHDEEAEQREAVRLGALKGSVTRQFTPLADALAALAAQVEALSERVGVGGGGGGPASKSSWVPPAPKVAQPSKGVAAARASAKVAQPAVGKRVSTARMQRTATAGDDAETPETPETPRRVATARVASASTAADDPEAGANGTASPAGRRVATGRVATGRVATGRVATGGAATGRVATGRTAAARPTPQRATTQRVVTTRPAASPTAPTRARPTPARVATTRVATSKAVAARVDDDAPSDDDAPVTAPIARVLTRRPAAGRATPAPKEPVVGYELEAEDQDDDDDIADWVPPAWVSAAARERADRGPAGTRAGTTRNRTTRSPG